MRTGTTAGPRPPPTRGTSRATYDYNDLGLQTNRTVTSAGGSIQRALDWSLLPRRQTQDPLRRRRPPRPGRSDGGQLRHRPGHHHRLLDPPPAAHPPPTSSARKPGQPPDSSATTTPAPPPAPAQSAFTWNLTTPTDGTYKVQAAVPGRRDRHQRQVHDQARGGPAPVTVDQTRTRAPGSTSAPTPSPPARPFGHLDRRRQRHRRRRRGQAGPRQQQRHRHRGRDFTYTYDPNANLTQIADGSPTAKIDLWDIAYTGLNQIDQIQREAQRRRSRTPPPTPTTKTARRPAHPRQDPGHHSYDIPRPGRRGRRQEDATEPRPRPPATPTPRAPNTCSETKANGNTVDYDYFLSGVLQPLDRKEPERHSRRRDTPSATRATCTAPATTPRSRTPTAPAPTSSTYYAYTYDPATASPRS